MQQHEKMEFTDKWKWNPEGMLETKFQIGDTAAFEVAVPDQMVIQM